MGFLHDSPVICLYILPHMKSLSVVFPAFNEEANIRAVVEEAHRTVPKVASIFEIIVVNDGSKDRTREICDRLVQGVPHVRVGPHPRNPRPSAAPHSGINPARPGLLFFPAP